MGSLLPDLQALATGPTGGRAAKAGAEVSASRKQWSTNQRAVMHDVTWSSGWLLGCGLGLLLGCLVVLLFGRLVACLLACLFAYLLACLNFVCLFCYFGFAKLSWSQSPATMKSDDKSNGPIGSIG